jgi:hypothetical protein
MIVHIAIYKWKPGTSRNTIETAMADIRALKNKVDGVLDIRCGENFSKWNEGYTHAFVVLARDKSALEAYRNHPDHVEAAKRINLMDEGSIGIDFED